MPFCRLLGLALLTATTVVAQPRTDAGAGASSLEALGRGLVDAINSGDTARQAAYLTATLSSQARAAAPIAERVAFLQTLHRTSGGLDIGAVTGPGNPVELRVRTRTGGRWGQVYVFEDRAEPGRIGDFGALGRRSPAADSADAWPASRLPTEAAVVREIERHAAGAVERDEFSGVVLVTKGDRVLFERAYGLANRDWAIPNTLDTRFTIASTGKMFTAVAVAQLVEAGRLRYTDRLADVLPEYPNATAARAITIGHLLSHSAGLGMLFDRPGYDGNRVYPWHRDLFPAFAGEALAFEPGTRSAYSNEGFVVLGAVVERITGQPLRAYLQTNVWGPAGMTSTDVHSLDETVPKRAVGYAYLAADPFGVGGRRPNWTFLHHGGGEAAGGAYTTAADLIRFVRALRAGRLVRPSTVDTLLAPHSAGYPWYGYGFIVRDVNGKPVRGHSGAGPGSGISAETSWFLDGSYTVVVLSNYDPMAAGTLSDGILGLLSRH